MRDKISVISLISYDASYLPNSIRSYYKYVDEIVLGLDKDRISWSNKSFSFNEEKLWADLKEIDVDNKITVVEDNFHRSSVPIENDTHERNFLKAQCSNKFILSFDADEVLLNAREFFIDFLPIVDAYEEIELMFTWFLLYKRVRGGYLIIADEAREHVFKKDIQGFSANRDLHTYTYCRWTNATKKVLSPLAVAHYSFCRPEQELSDKINNFGHSVESKQDPFYSIQKQVNESNYHQLTNFKTHGAGAQWPTLKFVADSDMTTFLNAEARLVYAN